MTTNKKGVRVFRRHRRASMHLLRASQISRDTDCRRVLIPERTLD
jgi:hypothetical protein